MKKVSIIYRDKDEVLEEKEYELHLSGYQLDESHVAYKGNDRRIVIYRISDITKEGLIIEAADSEVYPIVIEIQNISGNIEINEKIGGFLKYLIDVREKL